MINSNEVEISQKFFEKLQDMASSLNEYSLTNEDKLIILLNTSSNFVAWLIISFSDNKIERERIFHQYVNNFDTIFEHWDDAVKAKREMHNKLLEHKEKKIN